jgi:hypothetical protein
VTATALARSHDRARDPRPDLATALHLHAYSALITLALDGQSAILGRAPTDRAGRLLDTLSRAGVAQVKLGPAAIRLTMWGVEITTTGNPSTALRLWQRAAAEVLERGVRP